MKQKTSERFTDVMIELAKINAKLDILLKQNLDENPFKVTPSQYALDKGSLSDSGLFQEWRQTLTNQDKLVDCISTISIPPTTEYVGGKKDA